MDVATDVILDVAAGAMVKVGVASLTIGLAIGAVFGFVVGGYFLH